MTAKRDILYSIAKNSNGIIVYAYSAEKGPEYFCPTCDGQMILKRSGRTGPNTKRPHFAHKSLTPNCTPESALHYFFKTFAFELLQELIKKEGKFLFKWNCNVCSENHHGDLLKNVSEVKLEYSLKVCQPDIALFNSDGDVFAVIEVVVTHKPEDQALNYYSKNNIIPIEIHLTDETDLRLIESKLANPTSVDFCVNPRCMICDHHMQMKRMTIVEGSCWKCNSEMKIATIPNHSRVAGNHGTTVSPSDFTKLEIEFAQSKGVLLKAHYSKTVNSKYIANTCGSCGAFAGNHFLFASYVAPASYGELRSQTFDMGFQCGNCILTDEKSKLN